MRVGSQYIYNVDIESFWNADFNRIKFVQFIAGHQKSAQIKILYNTSERCSDLSFAGPPKERNTMIQILQLEEDGAIIQFGF